MAFSEFEIKLHERALRTFMDKRRPPPHVRDQVDLIHRFEGQSVTLIEVRPFWRDPEQTTESGIAKATYVKRSKLWKVYWMRADLRWHRYDPIPEVASLAEFLELVDQDAHAAFFG
jgi:hypothetical protein